MEASVQAQMRAILLATPEIASAVTGDVWLVPLKRAGSTDPALMANDPTPEAFDEQPPQFLRVNIVLPERNDESRWVGVTSRRVHDTDRYVAEDQRIAYYAPPGLDGAQVIRALHLRAIKALRGAVVTRADGSRGRIVPLPEFIGPVPAPEFAGTGQVAFDRVQIVTVARRD